MVNPPKHSDPDGLSAREIHAALGWFIEHFPEHSDNRVFLATEDAGQPLSPYHFIREIGVAGASHNLEVALGLAG